MIDYFPLTTAYGEAFCNRKEEVAHLTKNIEMVRPTLIMSPRRYGKTSLALRTFKLSKHIYSYIDFYKELSAEDIENAIMNGVGQLLGKIESKPKQLMRLASEFFSDMHVNLSIKKVEVSVEINGRKKKTADNIQDALESLHALAKKKKLLVVFFIDEFQKLAEITEDHSIEAAIRSVAQTSKNIAFVFSGSNRHLIRDMFYDSNRPFYKMCDIMKLDRIGKEHYFPYIQHAVVAKWQKKLSEEVIDSILDLTKHHPYYVNLLCSKLWLGALPNEDDVINNWELCAAESRSQVEREIDLLSFNQKRLLISLSRFGATAHPTHKNFLSKVGMSSTSLSQALSVLLEKDYVYKNDQGLYCVLDPLFELILS